MTIPGQRTTPGGSSTQSPARDGCPLLVRSLELVGLPHIDQAGGKGARLGELFRAGFPVPPGFVVTTDAYDLALRSGGIADRIPRLLDAAPDGSALAEEIAALPMPAALASAVLDAYRLLPAQLVAVRSSATTEDLADAASAGQHDSFLDVTGEQALLAAIKACWASLWNERAIAYRRHQGLGSATPRIAVLVQCMAPAEVAGVMFSANPVTGARDEIVIDMSDEVGEAVVSGLVTPDHVVVARRGHRVLEYRAGTGSTARHPAGERLMDDAGLRQLSRTAVAIERHFGSPQDIEWAWAGGKLAILQSRPITALPSAEPRPTRLQRALVPQVAEMFPVRPYPLDITTWTGGLFGTAVQLLALVGVTPPRLDQMCVMEDGVMVCLSPPRLHPTPRVLLAPARLVYRAWRHNPAKWEADPLLAEALARARELKSRSPADMTWAQLLTTLREALRVPQLIIELRSKYYPRALLAYLGLRLLRVSERTAALASGLRTKTTETNSAVEALVSRIRSDDLLSAIVAAAEPECLLADLDREPGGRPFAAELRSFLDRYGHRETVGLGLIASQPTWGDAPETLFGLLRVLASAPPVPAATPGAEALGLELLNRRIMRARWLRKAIIALVTEARRFFQVREDSHFYATLPLPVVRQVILECGRRLSAAGVLDDAADVWHLTLDELWNVAEPLSPPTRLTAELRSLVVARQEKRAAVADVPLLSPALRRRDDVASADGAIRGLSGSPGVATGTVRLTRDASEFGRLQPGDVLVAPYASPSWTPLFRYAAALVADSGGPGSHAAAVAREYGIPAVMGTGDGTRRLTDGQLVRVDGGHGIVTVLPADG